MAESICHLAGPVNWQPAQRPVSEGDDVAVSKSQEDIEAGARIRAHLRKQMKERSIDKAELARRIGADSGNTSRILSGARIPGAGQILRICRGLGINATALIEENPPAEFFAGEPVPPPYRKRP